MDERGRKGEKEGEKKEDREREREKKNIEEEKGKDILIVEG
jgi:hypothetical protein